MSSIVKDLARRGLVPRLGSSQTLRRLLRPSPEFLDWASGLDEVNERMAPAPALVEQIHLTQRVGYDDPALHVEIDATPSQLAAMFEHIRGTWEGLGEDQPFWSVISRDEFQTERIGDVGEFYELGRSNVAELLNTLRRNRIDPGSIRTCLEFGCGVGRVTWLLASEFERVIGCDVSGSHLTLACEQFERLAVDNIELIQLSDPESVSDLPAVDLVYSTIVLQHNPPPVIDHLIRELLGVLAPKGTAVIQVPTYMAGYRFSISEYLDTDDAHAAHIEMHLLPQNRVFRAAADRDCDVVEVFEDNWTGLAPKSRSNTFVIRKR